MLCSYFHTYAYIRNKNKSIIPICHQEHSEPSCSKHLKHWDHWVVLIDVPDFENIDKFKITFPSTDISLKYFIGWSFLTGIRLSTLQTKNRAYNLFSRSKNKTRFYRKNGDFKSNTFLDHLQPSVSKYRHDGTDLQQHEHLCTYESSCKEHIAAL